MGSGRSGSGNAYIDLHSAAGTDFDARILKEPSTNGNLLIQNQGTTASIVIVNNGTEAARFNSSNNLGIGTSTPAAKLDVLGQIFSRSPAATEIVSLTSSNDGVSTVTSYKSTGAALAFVTSNNSGTNTERGRFDSNGRFGVNTTSPAFTTDIVGQTRSTAFVETKTAIAASNIDLTAGNYFTKTISGTTTFTTSGTPSTGNVASFVLDLTNGGSASVIWWSGVKWASGTAPTLTTSGRDVLGFFTHDGGTTWNGFVLGKAMA